MSIDFRPHPVFANQRQIWRDRQMIGYCGDSPNRPIQLICHVSESVREEVKSAVESVFGDVAGVAMPPPPSVVNRHLEQRNLLDGKS